MHALASTGDYEKAEHEDVASIATGIAGDKGQVHVAFGTPPAAGLAGPDEVARAMDEQIIRNYRLHNSNLFAWKMLHGGSDDLPLDAASHRGSSDEAAFTARMQALPAEHREYALGIYANIIASKLEYCGSNDPEAWQFAG